MLRRKINDKMRRNEKYTNGTQVYFYHIENGMRCLTFIFVLPGWLFEFVDDFFFSFCVFVSLVLQEGTSVNIIIEKKQLFCCYASEKKYLSIARVKKQSF